LTFDGTRKWNNEVHPILLDHLISTINSLLSAHFNSYERNKKVVIPANNDAEDSKDSKEFFVDDGDIIGEIVDNEIEKYCYDAVKNDEKLTELLMLIVIGNSREEISKQLNVKISEVDNLKKRLRRNIKNYLEKEGLFHELK
jgi:DNA-directed RNA polymerase specialized sigma24 family protein